MRNQAPMFRTPSARTKVCCSLVATLVVACSSGPVVLDPFSRPYDPANQMPQGALPDCKRADFDAAPVLVFGTKPVFPISQDLSLNTGNVELHFDVSVEGRLVNAKANSDASPFFASHAVVATRDWVFTPAKKNGQAVATSCSLKIHYVRPK